jgi:hypothetical protein
LPRGDEDLEKAGVHIGSLGDAGEMLDDQAKVADIRSAILDSDSMCSIPSTVVE